MLGALIILVAVMVPIPEKLESVDPQVLKKYRQLYRAETRRLRRKSIYYSFFFD